MEIVTISKQRILKPWGFEEIIEINENYVVKRLHMEQGHRCSLQFHVKKHETVVVLSGVLKLMIGGSVNELLEVRMVVGDSVVIRPGIVHRMEAIETCEYLESSTPELDDVVRLSDDYKR
jgi:mannose-6-phosphate isomerase-like protein (cupin superfamily)